MKPIFVALFILAGAGYVTSTSLYAEAIVEPEPIIKDVEARISNGTVADIGQFPSQVFLEMYGYNENGLYYHYCGGALISNQTILIAANCSRAATGMAVVLGRVSLTSLEEQGEIIFLPSYNGFINHPNFTILGDIVHNDIALFILPHEITPSATLQPIALPTLEESNLIEEQIVNSGWGLENGVVNDLLLFADGTVVSNGACEEVYGNAVTDTSICFTAEHSPCQVDTGSPLIWTNSAGEKKVVGINSRGACGSAEPNLGVNVLSYIDWINENIV